MEANDIIPDSSSKLVVKRAARVSMSLYSNRSDVDMRAAQHKCRALQIIGSRGYPYTLWPPYKNPEGGLKMQISSGRLATVPRQLVKGDVAFLARRWSERVNIHHGVSPSIFSPLKSNSDAICSGDPACERGSRLVL